jgi:tubulin--tyrosine ligase-like protein 12
MNYTGFALTQLHYKDFVIGFEKQNPQQKWDVVQERIYRMMKSVFVAAVKNAPPVGIGIILFFFSTFLEADSNDLTTLCIVQKPEYRSLYGFDVMVDENFQPKLLEVNFSPDCTRGNFLPFDTRNTEPSYFLSACNYDKDFYNKMFSVMFTEDWMQNPSVAESIVPL